MNNLNPGSLSYENESYIDLSVYDIMKECDRKKSFLDNNFQNRFVNLDDLALIGFFYFKKPNYVKCAFCAVVIGNFEPNDVALKKHLNRSPNCPLLRRRLTENVPLDDAKLNEVLPEASYDVCGMRSVRKKSRVEDEIAYPEFRLLPQRMLTFITWPKAIKQKPGELAEAGFFYSGQSDMVICFSCGVVLQQWENDDNCWVEHKNSATKECSYLKLNHETVELNERIYEEFKKLNEASTSETTEIAKEKGVNDKDNADGKKDFESLCKICMERKANVVLLPCKHVAVCSSCVFGIDNICPICRTEVHEKINLFYA